MTPAVDGLIEQWGRLWLPPENLPLSAWAEKHFVLSNDYSSKSGELRLYGWQRGPLDAFTDPRVQRLVLMCGVQMLKTLLMQIAIAYTIAERPGPILFLQPAQNDADTFSKERIDPMVRDCEILQGKVTDKGKNKKNTLSVKLFPGGTLALLGAKSPSNVARRSIQYLFCDEVDKYGPSVGEEGDVISLAIERTATFRSRRKIVMCCSPTVAGRSRIAKAYAQTDQRVPLAPCVHCGYAQKLVWGQVRWDKALPEEQRPGSAAYHCSQCGRAWTERERLASCEAVTWRAGRPMTNAAGFWISHLYSPWKTIAGMAEDFMAKHEDPQQFKTFINATLAELWEEPGETPDCEKVYARRESYKFGPDAVLPQRAVFLVAGVDVQDDRLEYEVVAYGRYRESWSIEYDVIRVPGPDGEWLRASDVRLWDELQKVLERQYKHASGTLVPVMAMAIDTGSLPKPVYDFARRNTRPMYVPSIGLRINQPRTVVPVKGASQDSGRLIASISNEDAARKRGGIHIVGVGTVTAKVELYEQLRQARVTADRPAPGYCHFPSYEYDYFKALTSEKKVVHDNGVTFEKNGRNEPLDCRVYARAVAAVFGLDTFTDGQWELLEKALINGPRTEGDPAPPKQLAAVQQPRPAGNWLNRSGGFGGGGAWLNR